LEKKLVTGEVPRNKKIRRANLELLRCLAMMMVIVLHFLGKGELLGDLTDSDLSLTGAVAWFLEALCIVAVNVYMLISGFFFV
jgi:surface polysaccharide O-acyltransferase-like enzyme